MKSPRHTQHRCDALGSARRRTRRLAASRKREALPVGFWIDIRAGLRHAPLLCALRLVDAGTVSMMVWGFLFQGQVARSKAFVSPFPPTLGRGHGMDTQQPWRGGVARRCSTCGRIETGDGPSEPGIDERAPHAACLLGTSPRRWTIHGVTAEGGRARTGIDGAGALDPMHIRAAVQRARASTAAMTAVRAAQPRMDSAVDHVHEPRRVRVKLGSPRRQAPTRLHPELG